MMFPDKFTTVESSLIGLGAKTLVAIDGPVSPIRLWEKLRAFYPDETYPRFVLAVDMLYAVGALEASFHPLRIWKKK